MQNQGLKCFREVQNPWKHSDCCSKIDFAHLTTSAKASSWLGSIFLSKSIDFPSQFETKNTSEANFIFCCNFGIQNHPKFDENPFQKAWSELRISTLGHFGQIKPGSWSQGHLQGLSSCSFWHHMDLIWTHFSNCLPVLTSFPGQISFAKSNSFSYNGVHCSQLIGQSTSV